MTQILETAISDFSRSSRESRPGPLLQGDTEGLRHCLEKLARVDPRAAEEYRRAAAYTLQVLQKGAANIPSSTKNATLTLALLALLAGGAKAPPPSGGININTASVAQLERLPGIGRSRAEMIVRVGSVTAVSRKQRN